MLEINAMEKIFSYRPDGDRFEHLLFRYETIVDVQELFGKFAGTGRLAPLWGDLWKPLAIEIDFEHPGPVPDFPLLLGGPPIFSERAWQILESLIGPEVEALPISHPRGPHFAIHILRIIDALDTKKSRIRWSDAEKRSISRVEEYVWKEEVLEGHHMFRIPETSTTRQYVSEEFRRLVEANGLTGLKWPRGL